MPESDKKCRKRTPSFRIEISGNDDQKHDILEKLASVMKEILPQKFSITPVICLGVTKMTELRNKKKRCKYQKQSVITIEHFRFQFYKVFLYSCSFCKLCFKGTPLLADREFLW
jgi:hypothetical protein